MLRFCYSFIWFCFSEQMYSVYSPFQLSFPFALYMENISQFYFVPQPSACKYITWVGLLLVVNILVN